MKKDITDLTRKSRPRESLSETPQLDAPDSSLVKNKSNFCSSQKETVFGICNWIFTKAKFFLEKLSK